MLNSQKEIVEFKDPKELIIEKNDNQKTWYVKGVNINYSFTTLEKMALSLGAKLHKGDILVIDNKRGDKRKAFRKTENGSVILYVCTKPGREFLVLGDNGKSLIPAKRRPLINYLFV